jgi:hypothetical protein
LKKEREERRVTSGGGENKEVKLWKAACCSRGPISAQYCAAIFKSFSIVLILRK